MAARTIGCFRSPKTLNEKKATATFLTEEGRQFSIRVRGSRRPNTLPDSYDDVSFSSSQAWCRAFDKAGLPIWNRKSSFETQDKVLTHERRRLARKFKAVVREVLAAAVVQEIEWAADACYDGLGCCCDDEELDSLMQEAQDWDDKEYVEDHYRMVETAEYFGQSTDPVESNWRW